MQNMRYTNLGIAIYCSVSDCLKLAELDEAGFDSCFNQLHTPVRFDKVYLEIFRGKIRIEREKILLLKERFRQNGIRVSGGIATVVSGNADFIQSVVPENSDFFTFCYSNSEDVELLQNVTRSAAELFDELILDDFYFTNCRCNACITAKGERGWPEFRLEQMRRVSEEVLLPAAKQVNPDLQIIIKYPNWYDDYQNTGYHLAAESALFDRVYAGTETRNTCYTQQTLQRYSGYFLMRYLENVKPGKNGGGWFDTLDCLYNLGSYAEQAYLTLFAKAREITLFCWGLLLKDGIFAHIAGYVFDKVDALYPQLGNPIGIACYKPFNSSGENYLHGYLGMLGIPLEPFPEFTKHRPMTLLTESAKEDPEIIVKIQNQLIHGYNVTITSGLLKALQDRGLNAITGIRCADRKVSVKKFAYPMLECSFGNYYDAAKPINIPVIISATNDCTQLIMAFSESQVCPVLLRVRYGSASLFILTVPDDFSDLFHLPAPVLSFIRSIMMNGFEVQLDAPANVGLFLYDNRTLIVESFLSCNSTVTLRLQGADRRLVEVNNGCEISGQSGQGTTSFSVSLAPASYRVFRY
jgi:hypothetical protein